MTGPHFYGPVIMSVSVDQAGQNSIAFTSNALMMEYVMSVLHAFRFAPTSVHVSDPATCRGALSIASLSYGFIIGMSIMTLWMIQNRRCMKILVGLQGRGPVRPSNPFNLLVQICERVLALPLQPAGAYHNERDAEVGIVLIPSLVPCSNILRLVYLAVQLDYQSNLSAPVGHNYVRRVNEAGSGQSRDGPQRHVFPAYPASMVGKLYRTLLLYLKHPYAMPLSKIPHNGKNIIAVIPSVCPS